MLDDPRINFAISTRGKEPGLDQQPILEQEQTTCCYAQADKAWVHDPQGIAWESFYTTGPATTYGEDVDLPAQSDSAWKATFESRRLIYNAGRLQVNLHIFD